MAILDAPGLARLIDAHGLGFSLGSAVCALVAAGQAETPEECRAHLDDARQWIGIVDPAGQERALPAAEPVPREEAPVSVPTPPTPPKPKAKPGPKPKARAAVKPSFGGSRGKICTVCGETKGWTAFSGGGDVCGKCTRTVEVAAPKKFKQCVICSKRREISHFEDGSIVCDTCGEA